MLRKSLRLSLIVVLPIIASLVLTITMASAHGGVLNPLSRIYVCWLENAESPDTLPCQDLVNMSGTQPIYDWTEVNQRAGGSVENSMAIIPDGQLCSAGREKYFGLDQTRADWPITTFFTPGAQYTFRWSVTANHPTASFHFYVTKAGFNVNTPLKWSDLEKFAQFENPTLDTVAGLEFPVYQFTTTLPNRTGRHMIYIIWERHDSIEDFYSCSDVWFGTSPTPSPTAAPACTSPAWVAGSYATGATVSHNNKEWVARWSNAEAPSTAPLSAPWKIVANCTSGGGGGPTNTPPPAFTPTRTFTPVVGNTNTPTRTATAGPTATRTNTPVAGPTATRTNTPVAGFTATRTATSPAVATATPTSGGGSTCTPTSTITAPFSFDGAGTFCWQSSNLGTYINSWNTTSVSINGVNATNLYVASGSYPAKIGGFWYVSYNSSVAWAHFEAK